MANTTNHPAIYGPEVRARILERLSHGEWLNAICRDEGMPSTLTVVMQWGQEEDWASAMARAREMGYDARAERTAQLAANYAIDPVHKKIELENERWLLARQAPGRYGDRTALQLLDETGKPAKAGMTIIIDGAPGTRRIE
jgi:hypothetical protein